MRFDESDLALARDRFMCVILTPMPRLRVSPWTRFSPTKSAVAPGCDSDAVIHWQLQVDGQAGGVFSLGPRQHFAMANDLDPAQRHLAGGAIGLGRDFEYRAASGVDGIAGHFVVHSEERHRARSDERVARLERGHVALEGQGAACVGIETRVADLGESRFGNPYCGPTPHHGKSEPASAVSLMPLSRNS